MIVSPFTPLFFGRHKTDGIASEYIQTFATTDRVLLQLIGEIAWNGEVWIYSEPDHRRLFKVNLMTWSLSDCLLRFTSLAFSPGVYSVYITDIGFSRPFRVTDDPVELEETTLIQYSMRDNRQRKDGIFYINGMQYFFDFRVPGGFKDSGWTFGVESEQFVGPDAEITQLYGLESVQKTFTMGTGRGVPVWFGEMLNRILVCSHVYFDKVKYARKDTCVPEMNVQLEGVNSFVFTQELQKASNLDPVLENNNQLILRRTGEYSTYYRTIDEQTLRQI